MEIIGKWEEALHVKGKKIFFLLTEEGFIDGSMWDNIWLSALYLGVESALWSLLLSLAICVAAVSVFTAHPLLLLPVLITILGKIWSCMWHSEMYHKTWAWIGIMCVIVSIWPSTGVICLVVAIMYWLGWEMGAVEAISLSILVGSSVDYCLHLVEGYLLAGETMSSSPGHSLVRECTLAPQQQLWAIPKNMFAHMLKQANESDLEFNKERSVLKAY